MRTDELYKFSDGTLKTIRDELQHIILNFHLGYNKEMSKWTDIDKRRSELMVKLIDKQMQERRIIRNLEKLVQAYTPRGIWLTHPRMKFASFIFLFVGSGVDPEVEALKAEIENVVNRNHSQKSKLNPLETRTMAWDEAECAKYMAMRMEHSREVWGPDPRDVSVPVVGRHVELQFCPIFPRNIIERTSWDDAIKSSNKGAVFAIFELDYLLTIRAKVFLHAFWEMTNYLIQEKAGSTNMGSVDSGRKDTKKIPLPVLNSAIQSLLMGNSDSVGGDGWTSALTEVPIIMGNNGNNDSAPKPVQNNHLKCVKFGSGMLLREDIEAYTWLLTSFMAHEKQPTMVVTDQDGAMKRAIEAILTESTHRLCMWHIMQKVLAKICPKIYDETDFKERFGKLVWNMFLEPLEFEGKWLKLVEDFGFQNHKWMTKMFNLRHMWLPAYFIHSPLFGSMRTTSRSKSENAFFKIFTNHGSTLVNFMMCFESAMERQCYRQEVLDFKTLDSAPKLHTKLTIEGIWACQIQDFKKKEGCEIVKVRDIRAGAYRTLYT
ncbi:FAR1-related sequence 5-like protein [Tanacetum coccineum]